ncbi:PepSY domain-containing protein [Streptomyces sp. NPDC051776]|uniref:PepSY domain-containing protein n=1 Tax=Streptomyces sp. NPDC051776 TaxID=3155414 RepID=UPI0034149961
MKRNIVIATVTAAALVAGGTASAVALTGDGAATAAQQPSGASLRVADDDRDDARDDSDDRDDSDLDDRRADADDARENRDDSGSDDRGPDDARETAAAKGAQTDATEAIAAALRAVPGTVTSLDLEDDGPVYAWALEVQGRDGKERDVLVDLKTGKVGQGPAEADDRDDRDGDDDRADDRDDRDDREDHRHGDDDRRDEGTGDRDDDRGQDD